MTMILFFPCYQTTLMRATLTVHRLPTYNHLLKAGSIYSLSGFDVTQCNQNLRLSNSSLLIRLYVSTNLDEITGAGAVVETHRFKSHLARGVKTSHRNDHWIVTGTGKLASTTFEPQKPLL
ncbi:hypothetical protein HA466_0011750 [Hirschfeldia incana]|nr:hypothetical protein HA466_0011750 [Hirschfeldia incana]